MELPNELKNEIWDYCRANNITNVDGFMLKMLKQGFSTEKWGATPSIVPTPRVIDTPTIVDTPSGIEEDEKIIVKPIEKVNKDNKNKDIYGE